MCTGKQPVLRDTGYVNGNVAVSMGMGCVDENMAMLMRMAMSMATWLC